MHPLPLNDTQHLRALTQRILDPSLAVYSLWHEIRAMAKILSESGSVGIDRTVDISVGETPTVHGLAVSPMVAALCIEDFARTIVFIRGSYAAIALRRQQNPARPVRVLYAGCGPYATLAVPLMTMFSPEEATFTLLDLHPQSLQSAEKIVITLGLQNSVSDYLVCDASRYEIPTNAVPDVIMMEIMCACLKVEPQVAVSRHLLAQAPDAILVPEDISIDLRLIDHAREHALFNPSGVQARAPVRDRIPIANVFSLNRATIASWQNLSGNQLPAALVRMPKAWEPRYKAMLFTRICTYGEHILQDYDSGLSLPKKLKLARQLQPSDSIQFHYELGESPCLVGKHVEI
jgi:hypothetical protein